MNTLKIKVILGSTRQNRFSEKPGYWILDELKRQEGVEVELLDLRDYPMPFFDEAMSPSMTKSVFTNEIVKKWAAKIGEADAYIIVTPEYNHGYSAVLKNAMDSVYYEWNNKPVGFVAYGSVGGARAVEQLRQVAAELQMASVRTAVHIPVAVYMSMMKEKAPVNPELFDAVKDPKDTMIKQLLWWAKALKVARESESK